VDTHNTRWVIISFLIKVKDTSQLDIDKNESKAYKWIQPDDPTIPQSEGLKATFKELELLR